MEQPHHHLSHSGIANTFETTRHGHRWLMVGALRRGLFTEADWENERDSAVISSFYFFIFWKAGLITVWLWAPSSPSGAHRWFVLKPHHKDSVIYPEDPLFHHMKSAICLTCCHRAAYSQPTVHYFISLVCFPLRKTLSDHLKKDLLSTQTSREETL